MQGKVKYFNTEKGYGFIQSDTGDIFLHVSQINGPEPRKGDIVYFDIQEGPKGLQAINVSVINFAT